MRAIIDRLYNRTGMKNLNLEKFVLLVSIGFLNCSKIVLSFEIYYCFLYRREALIFSTFDIPMSMMWVSYEKMSQSLDKMIWRSD